MLPIVCKVVGEHGPHLAEDVLFALVNAQRVEQKISVRKMMRTAGISGAATWTRLKGGGGVHGDTLVKLMVWAGILDVRSIVCPGTGGAND